MGLYYMSYLFIEYIKLFNSIFFYKYGLKLDKSTLFLFLILEFNNLSKLKAMLQLCEDRLYFLSMRGVYFYLSILNISNLAAVFYYYSNDILLHSLFTINFFCAFFIYCSGFLFWIIFLLISRK